MKYSEFREQVKGRPYFRSNLFPHLTNNPDYLRRQLVDWKQKGLVKQLKRGMYALNKEDSSVGLSSYFLANELYSPSYISLESALSFYNIIPERTSMITSVTSKKQQEFKNDYGNFKYFHLNPSLYGNYVKIKDEFGFWFKIASREKAIIDFLYFKLPAYKIIDKDIFEESFRFQNIENLNNEKLLSIAAKFRNKKLFNLVLLLIEYLDEQ